MALLDDRHVARRILEHIDNATTDLAERMWREPVEHYRSENRLAQELSRAFRRHPTPFCPSAALPGRGSYLARSAAGTPLLVVRGRDGIARGFRNACRHRGMQLADGTGCTAAFACGYHGWIYGLDGALRHIPHAEGFAGLDLGSHALAPVSTLECHGLILLTQDGPAPDAARTDLDAMAGVLPAGLRLHHMDEQEIQANWKILVDGFLEGYHLRATHRQTFYPIQFDNLNVVETFGLNSRVTFPYRRITKLRQIPAAERKVSGLLTYVYHLFPNVVVATFPHNVSVVIAEPLSTGRTQLISYVLTELDTDDPDNQGALKTSLDFIEAGAREDRQVACSIQRGLPSQASEFFEFGRFEGALTHFHSGLDKVLEVKSGDTPNDITAGPPGNSE